VWVQHNAGADAAFRLTVEGVGLDGLHFAIAKDVACMERLRETSRVGRFIDEVTADGPMKVGPGSYPGSRWTGWTHPENPRHVFYRTDGRADLLRRSDGMTVHAEDPWGGYDVSADGTLAVTTVTLPEGVYYHCYRTFEDLPWQAHARFLVRKQELRRAVPTPRHLAPG